MALPHTYMGSLEGAQKKLGYKTKQEATDTYLY